MYPAGVSKHAEAIQSSPQSNMSTLIHSMRKFDASTIRYVVYIQLIIWLMLPAFHILFLTPLRRNVSWCMLAEATYELLGHRLAGIFIDQNAQCNTRMSYMDRSDFAEMYTYIERERDVNIWYFTNTHLTLRTQSGIHSPGIHHSSSEHETKKWSSCYLRCHFNSLARTVYMYT